MSATATVVVNSRAWLDEFQISSETRSRELLRSIEGKECTTIEDTNRTEAPGLGSYDLSLEGFLGFGSGSTEEIMHTRSTNGAQIIWTVGVTTGLVSTPAYMGTSKVFSFDRSGISVGEIPTFTIAAKPDAIPGAVRGTMLFDTAAAIAATGSGTAYQVGAATAQDLYATIHCTAFNGTSLDVIIESDDNSGMTSPATRLTFAQLTGVGSEIVSALAQTIADDWWRASYTFVGTSATFAVCFGIKP